jgi:polysaccharide export outer membrane protein
MLTLIIGLLIQSGCGTSPATNTAQPSSGEAIEEQLVIATGEIAPQETVSEEQPASTKEAFVFPEYQLGAGDQLFFRSFDDPTLDSSVVVRHDGYVSLPWVDDIKVSGKTRAEATKIIREAYTALFFEAEISLTIVESRSQYITVMGDVSRPSEFPYTKPITLLDSITMAGGLRINQRSGDSFVGGQGQLVKAFIIRHIDGDRTVTEYDLRDFEKSGAHASDTPVFPGDLVWIPEGINLVYIMGEVGQPDVQQLRQGMTLLQTLANSGGFRESTARLSQVVLLREVNEFDTQVILYNVKHMLRHGGDPKLEAGDIIYVPRKRLVTLQEFVSRTTGPVSQVLGLYTQAYNAYHITDDTVSSALSSAFTPTGGNSLTTTKQVLNNLQSISAFTGR